jgi:small subunit ribosomal protein S16
MVKIRLRRVGAKKQPYYRIVVQDSRSLRDGKFIETIGNYNPRTEPPTVEIDVERALHWLSVGAQPSEAVRRMLDKLGILSTAAFAQAAKPAGQPPVLPSFKPVEIEEEGTPEEDEEFEVDLLEEVEESEEEEEWESDGEVAEELEDFEEEDDWDSEVEDDDDDDDDDDDRPLDDE